MVLDCNDARRSAEFYRRLLGLRYRPGDEPPAAGEPDPKGREWLVLKSTDGSRIAFQQVDELPEPTWPKGARPQMLHLDMWVPDAAALAVQHGRALELGARVLLDSADNSEEPLYVFADLDGHPFCIFASPAPWHPGAAP